MTAYMSGNVKAGGNPVPLDGHGKPQILQQLLVAKSTYAQAVQSYFDAYQSALGWLVDVCDSDPKLREMALQAMFEKLPVLAASYRMPDFTQKQVQTGGPCSISTDDVGHSDNLSCQDRGRGDSDDWSNDLSSKLLSSLLDSPPPRPGPGHGPGPGSNDKVEESATEDDESVAPAALGRLLEQLQAACSSQNAVESETTLCEEAVPGMSEESAAPESEVAAPSLPPSQDPTDPLDVQSRRTQASTRRKVDFLNATTVVLKNVPQSFTRDDLVRWLEQCTPGQVYDYVYLPRNFVSSSQNVKTSNRGYAVINFLKPKDAQLFMVNFPAKIRAKDDGNAKSIRVMFAHTQGLEATLKSYSRRGLRTRNSLNVPLVYTKLHPTGIALTSPGSLKEICDELGYTFGVNVKNSDSNEADLTACVAEGDVTEI
eukprot:TRINITY_DN23643_c0_g1_i1.p1 TRINITY_DN23643_c0_g1~~TRINITY_DN23643_c0_g1_i1.p1  ORF type:complete len:456 (+),score=56.19 TRINITY_DN23643_c0_g1_i1:88-1368(+)